jgi:hypothetical protein
VFRAVEGIMGESQKLGPRPPSVPSFAALTHTFPVRGRNAHLMTVQLLRLFLPRTSCHERVWVLPIRFVGPRSAQGQRS